MLLLHGQARQMNVALNALWPAAKIPAGAATNVFPRARGFPRITTLRLLSTKEAADGAAGATTKLPLTNTTSRTAATTTATETATTTATATTAAATAASSTTRVVKGFRRYAEQFKDKPASHFVAFAILHEVTAIVPLPLVYFGLTYTNTKIPFPEQALEEGNKFVGRVAKYYGWDIDPSTTDGARMMLNMASSYALVKVSTGVRND
ncbi:hypothetical protein DFQ26_000428 [Actinomortierella ambigua]|nr:hypothetical protein DFQ26_000428 [Actinomortierella ambigua]